MDWNDVGLLGILNNKIQVLAITLIFMGGFLQVSRFYLDRRISRLRALDLSSQQERLNQLERHTVYRSVSLDRQERFVEDLKSLRGQWVSITCVMGDQEALAFAEQLKGLFVKAGWKVEGVTQSLYAGPIIGLIIRVKSASYESKGNVIFRALSNVGYLPEGGLVPQISQEVELLVGSRPM